MSKLLLMVVLSAVWIGCAKERKTSCCDDEPTSETVDSIWIGIPNVFTPSDDGQNDMFRPYINEFRQEYYDQQSQQHVSIHRKITFVSLKVMKMGGKVLYDEQVSAVKELLGWDGKYAKGNVYKGKFLWEVKITTDKGTTKEYAGQACSITTDGQENLTCGTCSSEESLIMGGGQNLYVPSSDYLLDCD
ncbi:MAG: hypothetical protein GY810_30625 [Aureispira sp.]|nr:hypothetical protein [Aureispira sp.]